MLRSTPWMITFACLTLACAPEPEPGPEPAPEPIAMEEEAAPVTASAHLTAAEGSEISGQVDFTETEDRVRITAHVVGAPSGTHGFHVHEIGDCSAADFTSAGDHFNPAGVEHGGPDAEVHHAGDLGNIEIGEDGTGHLELTSKQLTVSAGDSSVVGRAVILHADADDLTSQPTGAAGARLACGVVEVGSPAPAEGAAPGAETSEGAEDAEAAEGEAGDGGEG